MFDLERILFLIFLILILRAIDQYPNDECFGCESPIYGTILSIAVFAMKVLALRSHTCCEMRKSTIACTVLPVDIPTSKQQDANTIENLIPPSVVQSHIEK